MQFTIISQQKVCIDYIFLLFLTIKKKSFLSDNQQVPRRRRRSEKIHSDYQNNNYRERRE